MRLLTRSDFDGLVCGALLRRIGIVTEHKFVHPKDLQDGVVEVTENDVLTNVPFVEGCGLWFDHHSSEDERNAHKGKYKGDCRPAPSCARIVYEYYGGTEKFPQFADLMDAVDKIDSGNLTYDEITDPEGWMLIGFVMDPRTGLGRFHGFTISNYQLMEEMLRCCGSMTIDQILNLPDVVERIELYEEHNEEFQQLLKDYSTTDGNIIITDLRDIDRPIYPGNRFLIYSMFPEQNISVWIVQARAEAGLTKKNYSVAVGHSILNRTSKVDVGSLMLKYGGGGHKMVGTCQLTDDNIETELPKILDELRHYED